MVVYTSTYNVVFGGQEIEDGREEDLPYFPLDQVSLSSSCCVFLRQQVYHHLIKSFDAPTAAIGQVMSDS